MYEEEYTICCAFQKHSGRNTNFNETELCNTWSAHPVGMYMIVQQQMGIGY